MDKGNNHLGNQLRHGIELGSNPDIPISEAFGTIVEESKTELKNAKDLKKAREERKEAVAKRLNQLREESGEKQKTVANEIGINVMTLSGYEIGKSEPNFEVLVRLADYYKVSLDYIFCRTDSKTEFDPEEYKARAEERKAMNERLQQLEQELSTIRNAIK